MDRPLPDTDEQLAPPPGRRRLQFGSAFLILVMLLTAIAAAGIRWLLTAWELPGRRPLFVLVTVAGPALLVCLFSVGLQLIRKLIR